MGEAWVNGLPLLFLLGGSWTKKKKIPPDPRRMIAAVQRSWFRAKQRVFPSSTRVFSRSNEYIKHDEREREGRKEERMRFPRLAAVGY